MTSRTAILTDYRWEDTPTTDRFRTELLYTDPALLTMSQKGLTRALGFASTVSTENYVRRAIKRGHLGGEIGALTCPCAWLSALCTPDPAPQADADAYEQGYEAGYDAGKKAGYEAGRRARSYDSADPLRPHNKTTNLPQQNHNGNHKPPTNGATPRVHGRDRNPEPESGTGPESGFYIKTPESGTGPESGGVGGMEPPLSVTEALVACGMSREKAEARVNEFGESRCRDALDALAWQEQKSVVKVRAGFVVAFLTKRQTLSPEAVLRREKRATEAMARVESARWLEARARNAGGERPREEPFRAKPPMETLRSSMKAIGRDLSE